MSESTVSLDSYLLVVTHENGVTSRHSLVPGRSVVLGSSPHCGIHVRGTDVASMHCLIDLNDGVLEVQDWASSAGTLVNGSAISDKTSITENDEVNIGSAVISICRSESTVQQDAHDTVVDSEAEAVEDTPSAAIETNDAPAEDLQLDEIEIDDPLDQEETPVVPIPSMPAEDDYDWNADFSVDNNDASAGWDENIEQYDAETVLLLKAEIDDLRSMLAERDLQVEDFSRAHEFDASEFHHQRSDQAESSLQQRLDQLLAEAAENDERFQILQDLLESAELKNQAESEERRALEAWVGEIEHRIGQRESEWKAEIEAVRGQLETTENERNELQHQVREVASRFGAQNAYRDTLDKLQTQNAGLQQELTKTKKHAAKLQIQLDNAKNRESEDIQEERAMIAQERASVSRMRFELSRKITEFEQAPEPKNPEDREVALRIQTLRHHLREINEQERVTRAQKGESLFTRISSMWKTVEDRY